MKKGRKDMEQNFKFEFTKNEVDFLLQALGELPAKVSLGMIMKIKTIAEGQLTASQAPVTVPGVNQTTLKEVPKE